ncbi:MarR family transcriptional regulator [Streptomyces cinnamoneus]|uniref:MarR family winged helix-turn-helix transcriptional regulator n=1 Tax=Streptomyces cinnamoneus TaxID=53446 RepID=UPI003410A3AC
MTASVPGDAVEGLMALAPKLAQLGAALTRGRLHERATEVAQISLERPALQILGILRAADAPRRVGEIATEMQVEGPHATRHVQRLEKKGLVERVVDPKDRRARLIGITPAGADIADRYRAVVMGWLAQAFAHWSEHDRQELIRLAGRMADDVLVYLQEETEGTPRSADAT